MKIALTFSCDELVEMGRASSSINKPSSPDDNRNINIAAFEDVEQPNLIGDYRNVALLLLLYTMQGVPQGIGLAIPILLQSRFVSYTDQAEFSISYFPYSSKHFNLSAFLMCM